MDTYESIHASLGLARLFRSLFLFEKQTGSCCCCYYGYSDSSNTFEYTEAFTVGDTR